MKDLLSIYSSRYTRQGYIFLEKAENILNWKSVEILLSQVFGNRSDATGVLGLGYPIIIMFKILLLQSWYNLSDRETDEAVLDRRSFRKVIGLKFNANTPSYSTICRFRNSLIQLKLHKKLFAIVIRSLKANNLIDYKGLIVDSSIVLSSRKPRKTINIDYPSKSISYSEDRDAKWTIKSGQAHYGYKIHMSTDLKHGFITGGFITGANRSDTKELSRIIRKSAVRRGAFVLADKGYASQSNRVYLNQHGFRDGTMHKALLNRSLNKKQKLINTKISSLRGKVERTFGTLKQKYCLHRAKYLGLTKITAHFLMSARAFNIKKALNFIN